MKVQYFKETEPSVLKKQLMVFQKDESVKGILLLACDANKYTSTNLNPILTNLEKPVFGGIFPGIIFNDQKYETGFIIAGIGYFPTISCFENISSPDTIFDNKIMDVADIYSESKTMFVFIDGFAERINAFIESIFTIFGLEFNFIGGGGGSLSLEQKPCIITNQGLKQDCAIIAGINLNSGIGVKHGWESISGPYKVTSSEKTVIKELDFEPAYTVYKEAVERHSGKILTSDNFFEIAKGYPFGINKVDAEKVVRDPLFIGEGNSLICVGEVETGSFLDILTGDKDMLVKAAGQAVNTALKDKTGEPEEFIFFVDCISRVLFLENNFKNELEEVYLKYSKLPLIGILSIGEIANNGKDYLEFYNKTSVIGCF